MLHAFLGRENQEAKVVSSLEMLAQVNARIELLAEQILRVVGNPLDRVMVRLLQEMVESKVIADMNFIKAKPTPGGILIFNTAAECAKALGVDLRAEDDKDFNSLSTNGGASRYRFDEINSGYLTLRESLENILAQSSVSIDDIVAYEQDNWKRLTFRSLRRVTWLPWQSTTERTRPTHAQCGVAESCLTGSRQRLSATPLPQHTRRACGPRGRPGAARRARTQSAPSIMMFPRSRLAPVRRRNPGVRPSAPLQVSPDFGTITAS